MIVTKKILNEIRLRRKENVFRCRDRFRKLKLMQPQQMADELRRTDGGSVCNVLSWFCVEIDNDS